MTDIDIANADRLLTTTRSVRRRLDFDRPVPAGLIEECLDGRAAGPDRRQPAGLALRRRDRPGQAGGDRRHLPPRLGRLPGVVGDDVLVPRRRPASRGEPAVQASSQYLADHLEQAPVFLVPCVMGRVDDTPPSAR